MNGILISTTPQSYIDALLDQHDYPKDVSYGVWCTTVKDDSAWSTYVLLISSHTRFPPSLVLATMIIRNNVLFIMAAWVHRFNRIRST